MLPFPLCFCLTGFRILVFKMSDDDSSSDSAEDEMFDSQGVDRTHRVFCWEVTTLNLQQSVDGEGLIALDAGFPS